MISDEQAHIRYFFHAEHWKIGTLAAELGLHHDIVRAAPELWISGLRIVEGLIYVFHSLCLEWSLGRLHHRLPHLKRQGWHEFDQIPPSLFVGCGLGSCCSGGPVHEFQFFVIYFPCV